MPISRRRFIRTVLLASGTVLTSWKDVAALASKRRAPALRTGHQTFDAAHRILKDDSAIPERRGKPEEVDFVVVGGGSAGLAAAWQLKKEGKSFLLLENEGSVGGVARDLRGEFKGIHYPLGSTYFYRHDGVYREFLDAIGVHPIETGEDALVFGDGKVVVDWWNPANLSTLPISPSDREAFRKFREVLLAMQAPAYPLTSASTPDVTEYDTHPALAFVERFRSESLARTLDLYARSVLGATLSDINAYSLLNFYSVEFGDAFQIPCYTFPGGLSAVATATGKFLGAEHIRTNATALRVRNEASGAWVTFIDTATGLVHEVKAKKVIVATSKQVARRLIPDLPSEQSAAMGKLTYAPYVTVALCCNAPLFPVRAFDFWVNDLKGRFTDIIDVTSSEDALKHATRTGPFVYMLSSPRPVGSFAGMDEAAFDRYLASFAQDMAQAVEDNIPGSLDKIEELHVYGWGHSMVIPSVGSYKTLATIISRPHGNIHFAHSDNDIAPGWENAVWWGVETVRRVME